jgi:hypothetical protein
MSNKRGHVMTNLKQILYQSMPNQIFLTSGLEQYGIGRKDVYAYKKNGWIEAIGSGAFIKKGVKPELISGITAIQTQTPYKLHIGGRYALDQYYNVRHFVRDSLKIELFTSERKSLPKWFRDTFKGQYVLVNTSFLPDNLGVLTQKINGLQVNVSSPERALLELLYVSDMATKEAYQIFELMTVLKPNLLNDLLAQCKSVMVKRLFMYLASQTGYSWFKKLEKDKIDLGSGVRVIDKTGYFDKEYKIIVDKITEV